MVLDPKVTPALSLVPNQQDGANLGRQRGRQTQMDKGGEDKDDDSTMDHVLPSRSLLTSALDTWDEIKNAIYSLLK